MDSVKIFHNVDHLLVEHDCDDWEEFRAFVHFATEDVADVGYMGDLDEMDGIYLLTKEGVSSILYFPFTFDDLNVEIDAMGIFKN